MCIRARGSFNPAQRARRTPGGAGLGAAWKFTALNLLIVVAGLAAPDAADPSVLAGSHVKLERELDDIAVPGRYVMRLDRVDFPPGAVAHTHVHPGPGIRMVKTGEIEIRQNGASHRYRADDAWFERGPDPVLAPTTEREPTTFIRCMVLPTDWRGRNTITYVDPADADRPKLQRYVRFIDTLIEV